MRTSPRSRRGPAVALLGFVLACDGSTEPPAECTGPVDVSVSAGTTPTISWTPACGVAYLSVDRPLPPSLGVPGLEPQWTIRSDGRLIGPPVRYGVRPRGTVQTVPPQTLVAGRQYGVSVDVDTEAPGSTGFQSFIP